MSAQEPQPEPGPGAKPRFEQKQGEQHQQRDQQEFFHAPMSVKCSPPGMNPARRVLRRSVELECVLVVQLERGVLMRLLQDAVAHDFKTASQEKVFEIMAPVGTAAFAKRPTDR